MDKIILVIDDDRVNLLAVKKDLGNFYKTVLLNSAKQALKYLENHQPDLILLDVMMPEMNGFQLMELLQQNSRWKTIPVIFLTGDISAETETRCLESGGTDFLGKPFVSSIMLQRIKRTLQLEEYKKLLENKVEYQLQKISHMQQDIIVALANLIGGRDFCTGGHVKRTSIYVKYFLQKLLKQNIYNEIIDDEYASMLCSIAPLHDIGKITIPDTILCKAGKFTQEEYSIMKKHAAEGGKIIGENMSSFLSGRYLQMAIDVASKHHEKWDGTGYPYKLSGKEIPLAARIMIVADIFDALVSKRSYKEALPFEQSVEIMKQESGKSFEPILLECFLSDQEELKQLVASLIQGDFQE